MNLLKVLFVGILAVIAFVGGYFLGVQNPVESGEPSPGALTGPDVDSYLHVNGHFRQGGGVTQFTATSTQGAYTLTFDDMSEKNIIEIVSSNSPVLALTLPTATTTWDGLLPNDGDSRTWWIDNQHLAATTTTITAPSNGIIDLIGVTTNDDVIDGQEVSSLTCWRKASNTAPMFYCLISENVKVD